MTRLLDERYIRWLYSQVADVKFRVPSRTYWFLIRQLHDKEFVWFVPNDDNRVEDGRALRAEFLEVAHTRRPDPEWMDRGVSMLEMLIGLSRRLAFESDESPEYWFWTMLGNIHIFKTRHHDASEYDQRKVDAALDRVIHRTYDRGGLGGLFPLQSTRRDQRKVELWYQMNAYLLGQ